MNDEFLILNIREYLRQGESGEDLLKQVFSTFSCERNEDVERFLLEQNFTKKNCYTFMKSRTDLNDLWA